jgi:hypothetical protein
MEWNGIENSGRADAIIRVGGMRFRGGGEGKSEMQSRSQSQRRRQNHRLRQTET